MEAALISQIETWILGALQNMFDTWGWLGVAVIMAFENYTGITPSEVVLALAGWMLISEHQLPISVIFLGGLYAALGSVLGASGSLLDSAPGRTPLGGSDSSLGENPTLTYYSRRATVPSYGVQELYWLGE